MRAPEFWHTRKAGTALTCVLSPLGWIYGTLTSWRARTRPHWHAPVPVICVGNVVMGGAGKTIVSLDLARRLQKSGQTPHIILRGYGGRVTAPTRVDPDRHSALEVGDEALLLAEAAPTWVGSNRADLAKQAVQAGASVIVMDDGFQNPSLHKDLGLLVVDREYGFGNGHVFPAGPLREPVRAALGRAHAVIALGGSGDVGTDLPVFGARIIADDTAPALKGQRVIAFAGIGRPEKFFDTLASSGADIIQTVSFDDHQAFENNDIEGLIAEADKADCQLVTTEKDFVRIPQHLCTRIIPFPVRLDWDDTRAFEDFLLKRTGLS